MGMGMVRPIQSLNEKAVNSEASPFAGCPGLIHRGNTAGCIWVGENETRGQVIHFTVYEIRLTNGWDGLKAGEK